MKNLNSKNLYLRTFLIFLGINILSYATVHLCYLFVMEDFGVYLEILRTYLGKVVELITLPLLSVVVMVGYTHFGMISALKGAAIISACKVGYTLPYFYMYAVGLGFDSSEAILIAIAVSILVYLFTFLLLFIILSIFKHTACRIFENGPIPLSKHLCTALRSEGGIDLERPVCRLLLPSVLISCGLSLATEIYDTVTFFIDYYGSFTASEILLICFNYLLIIAVCIGLYVALHPLARKLSCALGEIWQD